MSCSDISNSIEKMTHTNVVDGKIINAFKNLHYRKRLIKQIHLFRKTLTNN